MLFFIETFCNFILTILLSLQTAHDFEISVKQSDDVMVNYLTFPLLTLSTLQYFCYDIKVFQVI